MSKRLLELATIPREHVARAFTRDSLLPLRRHCLGGYQVFNPPLHTVPDTFTLDVTGERRREPHTSFHGESSFNPKQAEHVDTVNMLLSALASRRVFLPTKNKPQTLDQSQSFFQLAMDAFTEQTRNRRYGEAATQALVKLLGNFSRYYPNYQPVLDAMFHFAASEGVAEIIQTSSAYLQMAINGKLTRETLAKITVFPLVAYEQVHYGEDGTPTHAIMCSSPNLANKLRYNLGLAAIMLVENSLVPEYDPHNDAVYKEFRYLPVSTARIREAVETLSQGKS